MYFCLKEKKMKSFINKMMSWNKKKSPVNFHVTLWSNFNHFNRFANDDRIQGIRLNSAMVTANQIDKNFEKEINNVKVPLYFDIKGMQLRVKEIVCGTDKDHLEFILNRPVYNVKLPCPIYFKAGEDAAKLITIKDGTHFIFEGGPKFSVSVGESIHILQKNFVVGGEPFLTYEKEKIEKIRNLGFSRWYLSYVYDQNHVDEFRELIGNSAELILKIENQLGLEYVANDFASTKNTHLMAARGDLYVEIDPPHAILQSLKDIINKDKNAFVGSRMLLSVINNRTGVPSCADFSELAWLYDIGYRNFLLCDELCLKEDWLGTSVNAFCDFRKDYCL